MSREFGLGDAGRPLVYAASSGLRAAAASHGHVRQRLAVQPVAGMLKEVLVAESGSQRAWRLASDEAAIEGGTDTAPPPLAWFTAGVIATLAHRMTRTIAAGGGEARELQLVQDHRFALEGSAEDGSLQATALQAEVSVSARSGLGAQALRLATLSALDSSPAEHLLRNSITDTFTIKANNRAIEPGAVMASASPSPGRPASIMAAHHPLPDPAAAIVSKLAAAADVADQPLAQQAGERRVHLRATLELRDDSLFDVRVDLRQPRGSSFRILAANAQSQTVSAVAPHGLAYVSAGLGFCFLAQLQRLAGIAAIALDGCALLQDSSFDVVAGRCAPLDTHVFLESTSTDAALRQLVDQAERACFLHAACRLANETQLRRVEDK